MAHCPLGHPPTPRVQRPTVHLHHRTLIPTRLPSPQTKVYNFVLSTNPGLHWKRNFSTEINIIFLNFLNLERNSSNFPPKFGSQPSPKTKKFDEFRRFPRETVNLAPDPAPFPLAVSHLGLSACLTPPPPPPTRQPPHAAAARHSGSAARLLSGSPSLPRCSAARHLAACAQTARQQAPCGPRPGRRADRPEPLEAAGVSPAACPQAGLQLHCCSDRRPGRCRCFGVWCVDIWCCCRADLPFAMCPCLFHEQMLFELSNALINLSICCCIFSCTHVCIVLVLVLLRRIFEMVTWSVIPVLNYRFPIVIGIFPIKMIRF